MSSNPVNADKPPNQQCSSCLFTVLTPTYNRGHTLNRVYQSLSKQTFQDFEWLVIDDGSTDQTATLVSTWRLTASFPIRYIWQENAHKKTAFNHGVRQAQGELLVALDSDDELLPHTLQCLYDCWQTIEVNQRARYVGVTGLCIRPDGSRVGDYFPQNVLDCSATDMFFRYGVKGEKFGCQRVDILRQFPFPEHLPGFIPERLVWWAIARAGYLTRFFNQAVRIYHDTPDSLTHAPCSLKNNALGLYLLNWSVLQYYTAFFFSRPKLFLQAAAQLLRFRWHLRLHPARHLINHYALTSVLAWSLVICMSPCAFALCLLDFLKKDIGKRPY